MRLYRSPNVVDGPNGRERGKPKNVILIGNGAVRETNSNFRGYGPIIEAFRRSPYLEFSSQAETELFLGIPDVSLILANSVFLSRIFQMGLEEGGKGKHSTAEILTSYLKRHISFRREVANQYSTASKTGSLTLRKLPYPINSMIEDPQTAIITTNWDSLLWDNAAIKHLAYIHGRCAEPDSLIFPTESVPDEVFVKQLSQNSFSRKGNALDALKKVHDLAVHWISDSVNLVIWGVAFNSYDAELLSIVSSATTTTKTEHTERKEKIVIINPSSHDVAVTLSLLRVRPGKNVTVIKPISLSS